MMRILELKLCVFSCFLVIQGFAVNPAGVELPGILSNISLNIAPSQEPQSNGTSTQPPLVLPPLITPISSPLPIAPSTPPSPLLVPPPTITVVPPPTSTHGLAPAVPPVLPPPAEPIVPPPSNPDMNSSAPVSTPPDPNQTEPPISNPPPTPVDPVSSVPPTTPSSPESPGPAHSVLPSEPHSPPPDVSIPPENSRNVSPPVTPPLPEKPVPSPPERDVSVPPENSRNSSPPVTLPLPVDPVASPPVQDVSIPPEVSPPVNSPLPDEPRSSPPAHDVSIPPEVSRNVSPPVKSPLPEEPRSSPPAQDVSIPPEVSRNVSPPVKSPLPQEPRSSPPAQDVSIPPEVSRNVPPPVKSPLPEEPRSSPPAQDVSIPPEVSRNVPPPVKSPFPEEPRASPPNHNVSPMLTPPPSISSETAPAPLPRSTDKSASSYAPVSHSPSKGPPPASKSLGHSYKAPSPHPVSRSPPVFDSPKEHHHAISPAPSLHMIPPPSIRAPPYRKKSDPKSNISHYAPPPTSTGSSKFPFPNISPSHAPDVQYSPSSPPSPSAHTKVPPKLSPTGSLPKHPKTRPLPPWQVLPPPPPPVKDCAPLTCTDPLTNGPPEYPCACVFPIQVALRLSVSLYTFFPLVSELAAEVAAGVFMKQSQVRIMGANAAEDNAEKTIVLIYLLPLGQKFDDTTAFLTFQRFWQKQVLIKHSVFGDYDVIYVRYPGLPPSPPLPPSTIGMVSSKPYPGNGADPGPLKPIGVDTRGNLHRVGPSGSIMATIVLSAFVAAILLCVVAWIFIFKHRDSGNQPDPAPPASTIRSLGKSSGRDISTVGSGPSSPAFSLGSSIVTYSGAAKTFTSTDLEKATDNFNEAQVLGEGGFGRVYNGVLEDGTKIAVKILKRDDQQGTREFLAEVEMLTRLHHRNLVKLIGICTEARTRCLVYELIPNGSVESHLHGVDKDSAPLDWNARLKIALGSARALAYLHEDSSPRVIHRDFKASNILLENDFTPKVSDFGLARTALDEDNKHISTRVMGTFGYVAPEYAMTGHLLVKSDVYSYGVVLLELLTGRKPVDMSQPPGEENLVSWARPLLTTQEGLESMIDPILGPDFPFDSIVKVAAIASMCVQPEVSHRPFMGEVVQALKLVSNEIRELATRNPERAEDMSVDMEARSSTSSDVIDQSPASNYDHRIDCERDVSMSELLGSSSQFDRQDSDSNRRHSSSGPIRTGRSKRLWKTIGRLSGGSVSEHGVMIRLWPGSH